MHISSASSKYRNLALDSRLLLNCRWGCCSWFLFFPPLLRALALCHASTSLLCRGCVHHKKGEQSVLPLNSSAFLSLSLSSVTFIMLCLYSCFERVKWALHVVLQYTSQSNYTTVLITGCFVCAVAVKLLLTSTSQGSMLLSFQSSGSATLDAWVLG